MIAVDTNVLVRVLVDDPGQAAQVKLARDRVKRAGKVYVPQIVQVETVWVLETAYGMAKPDIVDILDHLLQNSAYMLQNDKSFQQALIAYRDGPADFADYLVLAESRMANATLITFDKILGRGPDVSLLKA
jgi:Predicted nucleic-acid-binding protein, contains PIN domain